MASPVGYSRWQARQLAVAKIKAHAAVLAILDAEDVYDNRVADWDETEVKGVIVTTPTTNWESHRERSGIPLYQRKWLLRVECYVAVPEPDTADDADEATIRAAAAAADALLGQRIDELEEAVIENALLTDGDFVSCFQKVHEINSGIRFSQDTKGRFAQSVTTFDLETQAAYNPDVSSGDPLNSVNFKIDRIDADGAPIGDPLTEATWPIEQDP